MRRWTLPLVASAILSSTTTLARQPIPAESFARVPQIQSVSMSTDGKNLVALIEAPNSNHQETALATWDMDNLSAPPKITNSGDRMKFIGASAMKANRIIVFGRQEWTGQLAGCGEGSATGATKTFVMKPYLTDSQHSNFTEAFAANVRRVGVGEDTLRCMELAGSASLASTLPLDPDNVIIRQMNSSFQANYYLYNLRTNETRLLMNAGGRTQPGLFNPRNGEVMIRTQIEPVGGDFELRVFFRRPGSEEFVQHENLTRKLSERQTLEFVGVDEATGKFYVLTDQNSDLVQAWMYDPATRQFDAEPLIAHPEFSIGGLILGSQPSNFNKVLGFTIDGPSIETVYVDPQMKSIHDGLKNSYPGQNVRINSYNDDLSRVLFTTESARHAPTYHLLLDRREVKTLGSQRPWINANDIGEQRWITYEARDGLKIPAILDLPAGWKPSDGPLPAIVHPHGGPWARDYAGWDASGWVPFLTSRGYAVLRPQYRGSSGLGRRLWTEGDAQWGLKMQDDKDDAAAWLVKEGIAAPDRIAIFGYSYGGFAAAAAAVRPNGPFQCAISGAPVTDLARIGRNWSDNRLQRILQGRTVTGMDPMKNTANANIPVLLYVGDRDVRTPAFHAKNFHDAIRGRVSSRFELIADMPHSMPWYPRHQTQTLGLIEQFLANDCGPGGL